MSILDADYIKEQAHKPCFWSEEYGFDVVAFTHAMEQNYSNRVGSKINSLNKELRGVTKQRDELLTELLRVKEICLRECEIGIVNELVIASVKGGAA